MYSWRPSAFETSDDMGTGASGNRTLVLGEAVVKLNGLEDGSSVLLLDRERPRVPNWLSGAQASGINEYRTDELTFARAAEEAHRLIRQWADVKDSRGRRLDDLARYEGIPLWEVAEFNLFYGLLAPVLDELLIWDRILEVERPAQLIVRPDPSSRVPVAVATAREIQVRWSGTDSPQGRVGVGTVRSLRTVVPPRLRASLRRWRSRVRSWRGRWHHRAPLGYGAGPGKTRRILVLTLVRRFVDTVIPVIRALERDPANGIVVVDRNFSTAVSRLEEESIPYRIFDAYSDRQALGRVREEETRLRQEWNRLRNDATFHSHFGYQGVNLWPLVAPAFHEYFTALFPEVIWVAEVTRNLLRAERPAVVVLTDDRPPFQRAFTWACRAARVPTVGIQPTLFADLPLGSPIATDWIAVEGEAARENLVKRGTPAEKIVVTGQPHFDFISDLGPRFNRDEILKGLGLDPSRLTVLLISQYVGTYFRSEDKRRALQAIYSAVATMPELQLVVKLHPDDRDGSPERELAAAAGLGAYRIIKSGETLQLIFASDLVIVFFSTVGHEAMLMGRPLIQIPTAPSEGQVISFTEEDGALGASRVEELPTLIRAALYDPVTQDRLHQGREAYMRRHVHALDGQSSDRVAELVVRAADTQGR
ncbi:MAG: UDP-N-acetylglucosamine 2-epimerase [Candidatus Methylomirabilales bacterium]